MVAGGSVLKYKKKQDIHKDLKGKVNGHSAKFAFPSTLNLIPMENATLEGVMSDLSGGEWFSESVTLGSGGATLSLIASHLNAKILEAGGGATLASVGKGSGVKVYVLCKHAEGERVGKVDFKCSGGQGEKILRGLCRELGGR